MKLTRNSPESLKRAAAQADPVAFARVMNGGKQPSEFQRAVLEELRNADATAPPPHTDGSTPTDSAATPTCKRRNHHEDNLQRDTCKLFELKYSRRCFAFHVPNGGKRNRVEAARLVGMGVKAGVADWIVLLAGGRFACIELKSETGYLSANQKQFRKRVEELGGYWYLVRTLEEFDAAMTEVLEGGK